MPTPFFYGRSEHRINAKGQVAVPARLRAAVPGEQLAQGLVLLRGEPACIYCYTHEQFRQVVQRVTADEETRSDAEFLRRFFEEVYAVDVDSQGRIVLPADLRNCVGMTGETVTFIGHDDRVEIWDTQARSAERDATELDYEEKRSRLARRFFGP